MPAVQRRQLVVLAIGFSASIVVSSQFFGSHGVHNGPVIQRMLTVFLLPTTASVIFLLLRSLQRRQATSVDDTNCDQAVPAIVFWILVFLIGVHTVVLAVLLGFLGNQLWASRAVVVLLGLTLAAVGNLLPRTRPNIALGIRTARTLTDRRLWMLTHRAAGYACVAVGMVTVCAGAFLSGRNVAAWSGGAFLAGAAIVVTYYKVLARA